VGNYSQRSAARPDALRQRLGHMPSLKYTPDDDVKVHEEGAIRLLCAPFQSHENGLPEWLKNSSDAYSRNDVLEARRTILVIFDSGRGNTKPSISCLDFCGMTSEVSSKETFACGRIPRRPAATHVDQESKAVTVTAASVT
jgi:hypothetical protein